MIFWPSRFICWSEVTVSLAMPVSPYQELGWPHYNEPVHQMPRSGTNTAAATKERRTMPRIIDSDGHVMDQQYTEEIAGYMPSGLGRGGVFPAFDHLHGRFLGPGLAGRSSARARIGAAEWVRFLDDTEIDWT